MALSKVVMAIMEVTGVALMADITSRVHLLQHHINNIGSDMDLIEKDGLKKVYSGNMRWIAE